MSKTKCILHVVISTKNGDVTIPEKYKRSLYSYIFGILQAKHCFVHRINGYGNHIHLLIDLNPAIALADLIRDVKISSNIWLKSNPDFPNFKGWGEGYFACSIGIDDLNQCREYIIGQELHHGCCNFDVEIRRLIESHGGTYHPNDFK